MPDANVVDRDDTLHRALIVGDGPAGISAALWLADQEVAFRWISANPRPGGTLRRVGNPIKAYPGLLTERGADLIRPMVEQLRLMGLEAEKRTSLASISTAGAGVECRFSRGEDDRFGAVLLCTGTKPRMLELPHEAELLGAGVEVSVSRNLLRYGGQPAIVVGGGDAALEGALLLAAEGSDVILIHRGPSYGAQSRFRERVKMNERISARMTTNIAALDVDSDGAFAGVTTDKGERLRAEALFVRVGVIPALPEGISDEALDGDGYLKTNARGETSLPGVFAAGDVTDGWHQSVNSAVGTGARAAAGLAEHLDQLVAY